MCAGLMALLGSQLFGGLASRASAGEGCPAGASVHMTAFEIVGERIMDLMAPALPPRNVHKPASPGQPSYVLLCAHYMCLA